MPAVRKLLLLITTLIVFTALRASDPSLVKVAEFGNNLGNLEMFVHVPAKLPTGPVPMVMVLHGCTQNASGVAELTGWNKLADLYGFYVLYPQTKFTNNTSLCFNWFREQDINKGSGECESIKQMVVYMSKHYAIDSSKTFVTGLSAGAAMSVVMMATHPEMFNAGAIFAGGPYKMGTNVFTGISGMAGWVIKSAQSWGDLVRQQNPRYKGPYPRMVVYQGTKDPVVNKRNAYELIKQWANVQGIKEIPSIATNGYAGMPDIARMSYRNKAGEETIALYEVDNMGHALLIHPGNCRNEGGDKGTFAVDKGFHSTYQTAIDFGIIPKPVITGDDEEIANQQQLTYTVPFYEGSKYVWTYPVDCTLTTENGTNQIILNWGKTEGDVTVIETDTQGCKYSFAPVYVTLKQ